MVVITGNMRVAPAPMDNAMDSHFFQESHPSSAAGAGTSSPMNMVLGFFGGGGPSGGRSATMGPSALEADKRFWVRQKEQSDAKFRAEHVQLPPDRVAARRLSKLLFSSVRMTRL